MPGDSMMQATMVPSSRMKAYMTLVTVEFLMPGQQLHTRHVALLQRHGTWKEEEGSKGHSAQREGEILSVVFTVIVTLVTETTAAADVTS